MATNCWNLKKTTRLQMWLIIFWTVFITTVSSSEKLGDVLPSGLNIEVGGKLNLSCSINWKVARNLSQPFTEENLDFLIFNVDGNEINRKYITKLNHSAINLFIPEVTEPGTNKYVCGIKRGKDANIFAGISYSIVNVGYKPLDLTNFRCISYNWDKLNCTFDKKINHVYTNYTMTYYPGPTRRAIYQKIDPNDNKTSYTFEVEKYLSGYDNYTFEFKMKNDLGDNYQKFEVSTYESVKPNPPLGMNVTMRGSTRVTLAWKLHYLLHVFERGFIHEGEYTRAGGRWSSSDIKWQPLDMTKLTNNSFSNYSLSIDGLYAHMWYDVRIRVRVPRAAREELWSNYTSFQFQTHAKIPDRPPRVDIGCFYVNDHNDVVLYWEQLPLEEQNGNNSHYVVKDVRDARGGNRSVIKPTEINTIMARFVNLPNEDFTFTIHSANSEGESIRGSTIYVPAKGNRFPMPTELKKFSINGKYRLTWAPPKERQDELVSYTVFWCESKTNPNECDGPMSFETVDASVQEYELDYSKAVNMALSANSHKSSSGLLWSMCTASKSDDNSIELLNGNIKNKLRFNNLSLCDTSYNNVQSRRLRSEQPISLDMSLDEDLQMIPFSGTLPGKSSIEGKTIFAPTLLPIMVYVLNVTDKDVYLFWNRSIDFSNIEMQLNYRIWVENEYELKDLAKSHLLDDSESHGIILITGLPYSSRNYTLNVTQRTHVAGYRVSCLYDEVQSLTFRTEAYRPRVKGPKITQGTYYVIPELNKFYVFWKRIMERGSRGLENSFDLIVPCSSNTIVNHNVTCTMPNLPIFIESSDQGFFKINTLTDIVNCSGSSLVCLKILRQYKDMQSDVAEVLVNFTCSLPKITNVGVSYEEEEYEISWTATEYYGVKKFILVNCEDDLFCDMCVSFAVDIVELSEKPFFYRYSNKSDNLNFAIAPIYDTCSPGLTFAKHLVKRREIVLLDYHPDENKIVYGKVKSSDGMYRCSFSLDIKEKIENGYNYEIKSDLCRGAENLKFRILDHSDGYSMRMELDDQVLILEPCFTKVPIESNITWSSAEFSVKKDISQKDDFQISLMIFSDHNFVKGPYAPNLKRDTNYSVVMIGNQIRGIKPICKIYILKSFKTKVGPPGMVRIKSQRINNQNILEISCEIVDFVYESTKYEMEIEMEYKNGSKVQLPPQTSESCSFSLPVCEDYILEQRYRIRGINKDSEPGKWSGNINMCKVVGSEVPWSFAYILLLPIVVVIYVLLFRTYKKSRPILKVEMPESLSDVKENSLKANYDTENDRKQRQNINKSSTNPSEVASTDSVTTNNTNTEDSTTVDGHIPSNTVERFKDTPNNSSEDIKVDETQINSPEEDYTENIRSGYKSLETLVHDKNRK